MLPKNFYYKTNRLQQLRGFYYTAQFRSVTKAAQYMNISQPTVTMQIKSLEQDLKTQLFEHNGPKIILTEIGKKLYLESTNYIETINNLFDKFYGLIKDDNEKNLNIVANQATMIYLLPEIIKNHLDKDENLNIRIHNKNAQEAITLLQELKADIIVGPNSFNIPFDYDYTPLFYYKPVVITPPNHPLAGHKNLTVAEIAKYKVILPPAEMRTIKTIDNLFLKHNFNNRVRLEFDNWEIVKKYVEADIGITIAAEIAIEETDNLVGTVIEPLLPSISYGYILKKNIPITSKVNDFLTTMKQYTPRKKKNIV